MSEKCLLCGSSLPSSNASLCYKCETGVAKGGVVLIEHRLFWNTGKIIVCDHETITEINSSHDPKRTAYWAKPKVFKKLLSILGLAKDKPKNINIQ